MIAGAFTIACHRAGELVPAPPVQRHETANLAPRELAAAQRHSTGMLRTIVLFAVAATASLSAQSLVVVPNDNEHLEGTSAARTPLGWTSSRIQYLVDGAQLCQTGALLTSLQLRLDGGNFNVDAPIGKTFQADLVIYEVPTTPTSMVAQWATNIGSAVGTTVYRGSLSVPAVQRQWPFPNPWTVDIRLQTPFFYQRANGNLLLDLVLTGGTGDNWPADGFFLHGSEARGEFTRIQIDASCASPRGDTMTITVPDSLNNGTIGYVMQVDHVTHTAPGGTLDFVHHCLGFDHRHWYAMPLPLDLAPFGFPGCHWAVDPLATQAVPAVRGSCTWPIPLDTALIGVALFTQAFGADTLAGTLVPSQNAWQVRLGATTAATGPAQMVHRSNYGAQLDGAKSPTGFYGLVMGFVGAFW